MFVMKQFVLILRTQLACQIVVTKEYRISTSVSKISISCGGVSHIKQKHVNKPFA